MYQKDFNAWNSLKKSIDSKRHKPPLFKEREIWWCSFGVNVGSEVCGKSTVFRRPVLIVKKLSHTSFIGVPLSTKSNIGTWYIEITHSNGMKNTANLAQIKYVDYRRLDKRIGTLDEGDFLKVKEQIKSVLNL
jgi:mRNA interferase MazF